MSGLCIDCEFCFTDEVFGFICGGIHYGENVADSRNQVKECYFEAPDSSLEKPPKEEIVYLKGTTLADIRIDGRKCIRLQDEAGRTLAMKGSVVKKLLLHMGVERQILDGTFQVCGSFDVRELDEYFSQSGFSCSYQWLEQEFSK